jgi:predicted Zn finger-like uncharacterized protein
MILTCPNCGTQYVVKDGAIPPQGRQVRCASCKHSWHQDPEPAADAEGEQPDEESIAEATMIEPRSGPEAEQRAYEEALIGTEQVAPEAAPEPEPQGETEAAAPQTEAPHDREVAEFAAEQHAREMSADLGAAAPVAADWREPPQPEATDDEFSPFPIADEVEPHRRSPVVTIVIVALVVAAIAAAFYFLAPDTLKARVGLSDPGASPLALVTTHMDRQKLESGNELLTVTGRVINPTAEEQDVPPLQAQLRTRTGEVVYSWTIAPPARSLPAGASASFNSAEVNVPPGGDELTITLGEPQA